MRGVKVCLVLALGTGIVLVFNPKLYADETSEAILRLLIKKGIITQQEVDEIKSELAEEKSKIPKTIEERVVRLEKQQEKLPKWAKNMKLKGDLRLRNENIMDDLANDNNRQRVRFRVGAETKFNDLLKVAFGLASGSSDSPTSTNQTLEEGFQSKNIWLDYAYVSYEPYEWLHLIGGKFKSPYFHTDMLWDSDIRFDGFATKLSHNLNPESKISSSFYLTGGYFPIDDANSAGDDVYLFATQVGTKSVFGDGYVNLKTGLAYYYFHGLKGVTTTSLAENRGTNTTLGGVLVNDYEVLSPTIKLSFKDMFGLVDMPWGIVGEYAHNFDPEENNDAWRLGSWLGKSKVKHKGEWKLLGQYSRLESDAFFDSFPDSDFNHAGTDGKGWEVIFGYGLTDNIIFSVDYYNTDSISGVSSDQQILQSDLIFKF
jgi:hypothetical protein